MRVGAIVEVICQRHRHSTRRAALPATALLLLSLAACGEDQQQAASGAGAPAPSVVVAPVVREDVTPSFGFVGRVEAIQSVELRARVEGFLQQRDFVEGGDIKKGDTLYVIEQAPYEAQVERAKADLASAEATLENATLTADRYRTLIKKGNVSQAKLDEAIAEETRGKAGVQEAKAALRQTELDLSYTTISAPIDGRIGLSTYSIGNLVGPSSEPLAELINLDPIYVQIAVSDRDLLNARRDDYAESDKLEVHLVLGDGAEYPHTGYLAFVDNKVDAQTDTVTVRAEFPNPNRILLPDQFVNVEIQRSDPVSALVVPQASIQEDQTGHYVLVVDKDNKVQVRRVTLGAVEGTDWIVEQGVDQGEQVVVEGLQKVRPGITVNPVVESAAPPAGGTPPTAEDNKPDQG